ncbi:MAG: hypothetical protein IPK79_10450 [Vampirovibrionales bacterium]|nr:hypothetical protein [Vampirovibrionales bacterium]
MNRLNARTILAPLLVMLMLTVVVGYSAYEMTQRWGAAIQGTTLGLARAQALNNIQWQLRQAQAAINSHRDDEARAYWAETQKQVASMSGTLTLPKALTLFMNDPENMGRINAMLQADFFQFNPERTQQTLVDVQRTSGSVTLMITISMAVLGLLLMGVTAVDLTRLFKQLARSRDLAITIQEEERRRISHELHDEIIQGLIELRRSFEPHKADALIDSVRRICQNLKPQALEDLGLADALAQLAEPLRQEGVTVTLNLDPAEAAAIPHGYDLLAFRIAQELFQNIRRHAQATQASLTLIYDPKESPLLRLYIHDNGVGFDPQRSGGGGLGLPGVHDRVLQAGGRLVIRSAPTLGSTFQVLIPVYIRRKGDVPAPSRV